MGVPTHWGGDGNGEAGQDMGVYPPPPEHGRTINFDSSYHGLVSGDRAESGTATFKGMTGAARSGYTMDKSGACISGGGGVDGD